MTEKGFFSLYCDLDVGDNTFVFTQGEQEFPYTDHPHRFIRRREEAGDPYGACPAPTAGTARGRPSRFQSARRLAQR